MAPELLFEEFPCYTPASDVYAFGMLVYQIFALAVPFFEKNDAVFLLSLASGDRPQRPKNCRHGLWTIAERCWSTAAADRPTMVIVSEHLSQHTGSGSRAIVLARNTTQLLTSGVRHCESPWLLYDFATTVIQFLAFSNLLRMSPFLIHVAFPDENSCAGLWSVGCYDFQSTRSAWYCNTDLFPRERAAKQSIGNARRNLVQYLPPRAENLFDGPELCDE